MKGGVEQQQQQQPIAAEAPVHCQSKLNCSLNGVCDTATGTCTCIKPWGGNRCGVLQYQSNQPMSGANLYPHNDSDAPKVGPCVTPEGSCNALNTWNGPIVQSPTTGLYHLFNPLYKKGSLFATQDLMHGVATTITGPYNWTSMGQGDMGSNPAFVTYTDPVDNTTKYSLWMGNNNRIYVSESLEEGPWEDQSQDHGPGSNPAPIFYQGAWYAVTQSSSEIVTATHIGDPWVHYADINVHLPADKGIQEDPFMWVDQHGSWHIINHAYAISEYDHCGQSTVSAHMFSTNGKVWHMLENPYVEPYSHAVKYEDGTSHTYTTLERPNCHFNAQGQMTHINLAADMMSQDNGCSSYQVCPAKVGGKCACTNCKYSDHAGTIIIALEV